MLHMLVLPTTILLGASAYDLKSRKVPNSFVVASLIASLAYLAFFGSNTLPDALFGFLTAFLILLPLYILKAIGGGDVKIFAVFGLLTNTQIVLEVFIFSLFMGAAIGLIKAFSENKFRDIFSNLKKILTLSKPNQTTSIKIPFTVALFLGWITHLIYNYYGRFT